MQTYLDMPASQAGSNTAPSQAAPSRAARESSALSRGALQARFYALSLRDRFFHDGPPSESPRFQRKHEIAQRLQAPTTPVA